MRRLAVIPARGGSKGIPNKNLQIVGGQSLVCRAVMCAEEAQIFDRILVSTDSVKIAEHLRQIGHHVPFLRSAESSGDATPTAAVIAEVLNVLGHVEDQFDTVTVLEPTSPMRTAEDVVSTTLASEAEPYDAALTLSPVDLHFVASKQIALTQGGVALQACTKQAISASQPRQFLEPTFIRNGAAYSVRVETFLATSSLLGTCARGIVLDRFLVNIDTFEDLLEAQEFFAH